MKNIFPAAAVLLLAGTLVLPQEAAAQYRRSGVSFTQPYAQAYDIEVLRDTALERRVPEYAASRSQEQPETWTLHDCMQYAVAHSPEMRLQQATNDDRRIDRREAAFGFLPTISAGTSGSFNFGRGIDPETNVYTNTTTFSNSYSLSADLDLFNGFSAVNNFRIAKTAVLLGVEEEQIKKDDICLQVIQAYYNVLYYRGMVELAREQLEESRTTLEQARVQSELGLKSYADVLQIESDVAAKDFNLTQQENTLEQGILTLKTAMYYPFDDELTLAEVEPSVLFSAFSHESDADSIAAAARGYLPAFRAEELKVRSAEFDLMTAKWSLVPYIYAQGGYSTGYVYDRSYAVNDPFWDQMNEKQGQYVGIGISIPIFNGLYKYNQIARKRNALATAEANRDIKYQQVEGEIRRAVQDMRGAAKQFVSADKKVNALVLSHQANSRKYEEGLMTVIELQTSSNSLLEARAERLNQGLQYLLKERVVMYYKGITYLDQE